MGNILVPNADSTPEEQNPNLHTSVGSFTTTTKTKLSYRPLMFEIVDLPAVFVFVVLILLLLLLSYI